MEQFKKLLSVELTLFNSLEAQRWLPRVSVILGLSFYRVVSKTVYSMVTKKQIIEM